MEVYIVVEENTRTSFTKNVAVFSDRDEAQRAIDDMTQEMINRGLSYRYNLEIFDLTEEYV